MRGRPSVIFLDAAHEYPETELEIELAWSVLAPGGYLIGDDYDEYWPSVQQSVNEFVLRKGKGAFASPWPVMARWVDSGLPAGGLRAVDLLDALPTQILPNSARRTPVAAPQAPC